MNTNINNEESNSVIYSNYCCSNMIGSLNSHYCCSIMRNNILYGESTIKNHCSS